MRAFWAFATTATRPHRGTREAASAADAQGLSPGAAGGTTSRTFSRQPSSCWPIRPHPSRGTSRWKAGCAPSTAGWSCMHVPVHGNGKAGNDRSLHWDEPGLRDTAAFCPISIIPTTIPARRWSAGTFAGYSMPPWASFPRNTALRSYSATSKARPTRRPRDSLDGRRGQCRGGSSARSLLRQRLARCGLVMHLRSCAALAFARVGQLGPRSQPATVSVRQAMQSLRVPSGAAMNLESRVQRSLGEAGFPENANRSRFSLVRPSGLPSRPSIRTLAEAPNSGSSAPAKIHLAGGLDLGRAARIGDRAALLGAVRQLDTTCIGCHEIFRH